MSNNSQIHLDRMMMRARNKGIPRTRIKTRVCAQKKQGLDYLWSDAMHRARASPKGSVGSPGLPQQHYAGVAGGACTLEFFYGIAGERGGGEARAAHSAKLKRVHAIISALHA